MKKSLLFNITLGIMLLFPLAPAAQVIVPATTPNETQRRMMNRGYGMFVHFGMNTFIEEEWSEGKVPSTTYAPTDLDCCQWVKAAADAGFRYVLLVTKHHDGFCLWDSKFTDYDVAASSDTTDVVKAVADACREEGLQFGIYYSLWDRHEPSYNDADFNKYIDFMCGQLTELMSNYGEVCELWLDGGWDKPADMWDIPRIYNLVKEIQPYCAVGVNGTIGDSDEDTGGFVWVYPDWMTEDNTYYMRYFPGDFRLWDPKIASRFDRKQYKHRGNSYYLPFEHTICLSNEWNWFQKERNIPTRDIDELEELFYLATSNGNSLVINIPPDRSGKLREHEIQAAVSLAQRLGLKKDAPLPRAPRYLNITAEATSQWDDTDEYSPAKACDGGLQTRWASADLTPSIEFTLPPGEQFDKITIFEYCDTQQLGDFSNKRTNRIQAYEIEALDDDGEWKALYVSDKPMGDCKTVRLPYPCKARKVRLNIKSSSAPPSIYEFCLVDTSL